MNNRYVGPALMALGVVLVLFGVVRLATGDDEGESAEPVASSSTTSTTSTTSTSTTTTSTVPADDAPTTSSSTTTTSTTTAAPVATETVDEFFAVLKGALDGGDAATLLDRMNQVTIDRYGADQCEAYAASVAGTGLDATLVTTNDLASWDYTTDDVTTTVTGVVAADLERTVNDQTVPQTTHWQLVDGRYTWFTDCGSPV